MPNTKFDAKSFNPEAFKYMVGRIPNLTLNELRKSQALTGNPDIRNVFNSQDGTAYARLAMRGLLDGEAVNYDGQTDITATSTKTYEQGVVVVGRAKAWTEKDFSFDITGGIDFMQNIAQQIAGYKETLDQKTLLAVLAGIFNMTGAKNLEFVNGHTFDITDAGDGMMNVTTINSATNKACGAHKKKFSLAFMHPDVATNLENLRLIEYLKYTDKNGVTRDLAMGTINGKLVIIDDALPTENVAAAAGVDAYTKYTTFALGNGAFSFEDIGAKVPYEMDRDPKKNGGEDFLYIRQRKVFSPFGISYEKATQASLSPTETELKNGGNWTLVHSGEATASNRTYINHQAIAICRIISKG